MLTNQDIKNLVAELKKEFPTRKEVVLKQEFLDLKYDVTMMKQNYFALRNSINIVASNLNSLTNTVDFMAKRIEDHHIEILSLNHRVNSKK